MGWSLLIQEEESNLVLWGDYGDAPKFSAAQPWTFIKTQEMFDFFFNGD